MAGINVYCFLNCLLLAWSYLCLSAAAGSQVRNIFILAGQSNMAGRGGVVRDARTGVASWDGVVPEICRSNPAILRLNAELDWVEAEEPLGQDIDVHTTCGIGPGMAFANTLLQMDPGIGVVGLVPCAVGGTGITEWARGGSLYSRMVKRALASVQYGGRIQGVLWYQGESDMINREDADRYKGRLEKFFMELRDDLQSPALPIIQVAIASGMGPYVDTVRHAQLGIDLVNVLTVDAKGLPFEPDMLHLSTPAEARLDLKAWIFIDLAQIKWEEKQSLRLRMMGKCILSRSSRRIGASDILDSCYELLVLPVRVEKFGFSLHTAGTDFVRRR